MTRPITTVMLAAALLAYASIWPAMAESTGGTLVVGLSEDIRGSDPRRERDGLTDDVHLNVVEGLVATRNDLEVAPMLASKIDIRDEGKTYVFTLRAGVKFHNGAPLTSSEVKWSFDYLMAPDSLWRCRPLFNGEGGTTKIIAIETPDPATVVIKLEKADGSFLYTMGRTDCAQTPILHPASINKDGTWNKPIGTGPFVFDNWHIGQSAEIHRFADYVPRTEEANGLSGKKEALVSSVRFLLIPDPEARVVGLRSRKLDIVEIPWQQAKNLDNDARVHIVRSNSAAWAALLLNMNDPVLKNKKIRQAIAKAIDRQAIADAVSLGQWKAAPSPVPLQSRFHSAQQTDVPKADPEGAKRLLAEAGYHGQPIKIMSSKALGIMVDQTIMIESMLHAVGINAQIEVVDWAHQLDKYMKYDYQAQSFWYTGRYEPMGAWERIIGPESRKIWKSKDVQDLFKQGSVSRDITNITRISDTIYSMFIEEVPAVGLYYLGKAIGVNASIQGVEPSPLTSMPVWNISKK